MAFRDMDFRAQIEPSPMPTVAPEATPRPVVDPEFSTMLNTWLALQQLPPNARFRVCAYLYSRANSERETTT